MPTQLGLPGFGASLGTARGSLQIDTSHLERLRMTVRGVAGDVRAQFNTIGQSVQSTMETVRKLRTELTALSLGAGAGTVFGLNAARDLRNYRVAFSQLVTDQQRANELMGQLTRRANEFGIEVTEVWQLGRALLPVLKGNTAELDEWVKRAALLASTNPLKGTADAARAIQEYLAGEIRSIQHLFNIDPNLIREAQAQFSDLGEQMDYILTRMGATEEGARAMADAWVSVRNELKLAAATGFTPLLQALQPALTEFRQWLQALRESNPELLALGSGLVALAAVGLPTVLMLERMVAALKVLQGAGALGALGKAGLLGGAAVGGAWLGVEGMRFVGRATGNESLAETSLSSVWETLRQAVFIFIAGLNGTRLMIVQTLADGATAYTNAIATMTSAMGRFVAWLGSILPGWAGGDLLSQAGANLQRGAELQRGMGERAQDWARADLLRTAQELDNLIDALGLRRVGGGAVGAAAGLAGTGETLPTDAIQEWADRVQQIEAQAAQQRLDATRQYERQRAEVIAGYELQLSREAADFARERAQQEAQLQRDIARVRADAAQREAQWWADLQERIADLQSDSARRIEQAQEDHQRRLEELNRDHRTRLLEAAARLDAQAIASEQRQYAEQRSSMEEELERRTTQERENLAERIAQEQEAHAKRLAQARQADAQRIADMTEALRQRQAIEDEDRAIRLARMEEDHQRQLAQMEQAQNERLQQIDRQEAEERKRLDWQFVQQLAAEGKHTASYLQLQAARQAESLKLFDQFWQGVEEMIQARMPEGVTVPTSSTRRTAPQHPLGAVGGPREGYAAGGAVTGTGLAMLHGTPSRPEYVLDAGTTDVLRRMLGGGMFSQPQLVAAVAGGGSSVNVGEITIPIYAAPGMNPADIGRAVRDEFVKLLGELS